MTDAQDEDPKLITETIKSSFPHLTLNVLTTDFEAIAKPLLSEKAYIYGSSGSDALQALTANARDWSRVTFLPRVLRDVSTIDLSSTILGRKVRLPIFITPMGLMGMFHPDGEVALSKAAKRRGVGYVVSNATSKDQSEIVEAFKAESTNNDEGALFFQFYVPTDRKKAIATIIHARELGYNGLFITVDTPAVGKRVADRRLQARENLADGFADQMPKAPTATAGGRAAIGMLSSSLNWEDIKWMRKHWPGPIVVKGIQTAADAKIAADIGLQGVYLSNHGGRQLGSAPSAVRTLENIRLQCPEVFNKLEVFVDGSARSGEDVLKALCLGAKAVGVGRPFMWALAAYGQEGAERVVDSKLFMQLLSQCNVEILTNRNYSSRG